MKTIVIIGGSRGIGNAILNDLVSHHKIVNISRAKPLLDHPNLSHFSQDILKEDLPTLSTVDTLIYCPGSINLKPFLGLEIDDFKADFEINVLGAVKVIQKYLNQLKKANNPTILLFSTVATKLGMPYHASVAVSKYGVEGLVKSLAAELAPKIRVNAIAPTVTDTDLASNILRNDNVKERIIERHPLKKYLHPQEVAYMAKFLISEKATSMTGQIVSLDCGIVSVKT